MILRKTNKDKDFYQLLGPVFGSRNIEKATSDRFYDDDGKTWLLWMEDGLGSQPKAVVSLLDGIMKNVYGEKPEPLTKLLKEIRNEVRKGIVPAAYRKEYEAAGYAVAQRSANFVEIGGGHE